MIIKKFQGKNENEALEAAKKELGNAVVIMNVRKVKPKGFFSFFRAQQTEVTVALEEERERQLPPESEPAEKASAQKAPLPELKPLKPVGEGTDDIQGAVMDIARLQEKYERLEAMRGSGEKAQEKKPAPAREQAPPERPQESVHSGSETPEEGEYSHQAEPSREISVFRELLLKTMMENEVEESFAREFLEDLEELDKPNMPLDVILAEIYQKMILKFGKAEPIVPAEKPPKVAFFIGPTGVGKTTTIAKLASRFSIIDKKKVALLTTDTYRIAAAEQLRTYASILEVPFHIIYTPEEMTGKLKELASYDFIFVDTSGHSPRNIEMKDTVGEFIEATKSDYETEVFLVLSATTKHRDLVQTTEAYEKIGKYKLIFTKLDETDYQGNLLNMRLRTGAALSYVTNGQNVPDDIKEFHPQKTVKQLLGGKKDS